MMRGSRACAVAVRAPDQSIVVDVRPLAKAYRRRWARLPFVRGLFILWDSLVLGMRAMTFSANIQLGEGEQIDLEGHDADGPGVGRRRTRAVPAAPDSCRGGDRTQPRMERWWGNLLEGLIRLVLVIAYIAFVGRLPDVSRVFAYHGAEHKTINAFEAGSDLVASRVATFPREHARCGTAFLLTVVVFSVVVFSLLGPLALVPRLISRLLLVPLLAGVAYEYIRLTGRFSSSPWMKPLLAPNLAMQALTTREPDQAMIEVALAAFRAMQLQRGRGLRPSITNRSPENRIMSPRTSSRLLFAGSAARLLRRRASRGGRRHSLPIAGVHRLAVNMALGNPNSPSPH